MAASTEDPVVFTQLGGGEVRLTLQSTAVVPERGVSDGVSQRTNRVWLPGAKEPVTQVLGPSQEPMRLTGVVRDELVGDGAAKFFDTRMRILAIEGYPVRLEWGSQWDKTGMVESYTPEWDDFGCLRWTVEFAVHTAPDPDGSFQYERRVQQTRAELEALVAQAKQRAVEARVLSFLPVR